MPNAVEFADQKMNPPLQVDHVDLNHNPNGVVVIDLPKVQQDQHFCDDKNPDEPCSASCKLDPATSPGHCNIQPSPLHKVDVPPVTNITFQQLANNLKDRLHQKAKLFHVAGCFRDPNRRNACAHLIHSIFPILQWAPKYRLSFFRSDLIAGLTIASLAIPQGISYADLAGLPHILGLYSSFLPPLVYALMGSSRDLAVGTVSTVSIMLRSLLAKQASDPALQLKLAITATFFAGIFQASLGLMRLGFILDLLSHATLVGFMSGAAITISLQQAKGLLGIQHFTTKTDLISVTRSVIAAKDEWNWHTAVIGTSFLIWLLTARHISKRRKKLFWVSAIAPLLSVIVATLLVYLTRADKHGVTIVGDLKKGLNPPSTWMISLRGEHALQGMKIGFITGLIALTEAIAVGRTFAALKDYRIDGNKEMTAIGIMNIAGSCMSCYITTGSLTRSAISHNAGGKTAATNIVMAIVVMITLLFLTPLFRYTPAAVLSSVIIAAVTNLIDIPAMVAIWKVDKIDFLVVLGALVGVLFMSVYMGLVFAIGISMLKLLSQVIRPRISVLGNVPETSMYRNIDQYPDANQVLGVSIVRVDAAISFSNANYIQERIFTLVTPEQKKTQLTVDDQMHFVVLELSAVSNIDTTGVYMLDELRVSMKKRNVQLALANPAKSIVRKLKASGFLQQLGEKWMFISVGEAISYCSLVMRKEEAKESS